MTTGQTTEDTKELAAIRSDYALLTAAGACQVLVNSPVQRDRANELWLRVQKSKKTLAAQVKGIKEKHKLELEAYKIDEQLLAVADQTLERAILDYDAACEADALEQQDKDNKKYDKQVDRAIAKGNDPSEVAPPPLALLPVKTQAVAGVGSSTVKKDYTYVIVGCQDPGTLRLNERPAQKMLAKYFKLSPPELAADHPDAKALVEQHPEWFVLNLKLVNNDVRASKGEPTVPGVVITERKRLAGRV